MILPKRHKRQKMAVRPVTQRVFTVHRAFVKRHACPLCGYAGPHMVAHNTKSGVGNNPDGRKGAGGSWFYEYGPNQGSRNTSSGSSKRKFASAMIAKIPLPLARYIAAVYYPGNGSTE